MRIIGGSRRGLKLAEVGEGDQAAHLRPTSDRVREAIFNLLINAHGNPVAGARVLDLFAGTGALGLEALSRGAAEVTFVDDGAKAPGVAQGEHRQDAGRGRDAGDPAGRAAAGAECRARAMGWCSWTRPTARGWGRWRWRWLLKGGWLAPGAMVVWEEGAAPVVPEGFALVDQRKYGDTVVTLLRAPE